MALPDMPNVPPQNVPAIIVQASSAQQTARQDEHILGICGVVYSGLAGLSPQVYANSYFKMNGNNIDLIGYATARVSILQQPAHGVLEPDLRGDWRGANYVPNDGYLGDDFFVIEVEGSGYKVKLHYFMFVTDVVGGVSNPNPVCKGDQGRPYWKISATTAPNGNNITAVEFQPSLADASSFPNNTFRARKTRLHQD